MKKVNQSLGFWFSDWYDDLTDYEVGEKVYELYFDKAKTHNEQLSNYTATAFIEMLKKNDPHYKSRTEGLGLGIRLAESDLADIHTAMGWYAEQLKGMLPQNTSSFKDALAMRLTATPVTDRIVELSEQAVSVSTEMAKQTLNAVDFALKYQTPLIIGGSALFLIGMYFYLFKTRKI